MERSFGQDFSRVRIHAGAEADRAAASVNAAAFTIGHEIVFGSGRFAPHTPAGGQLLAHELAHTVQQRNAIAGPTLDLSSSRAESEARTASASVNNGGTTPSLSPVSSLSLAKQDPKDVVPPAAGAGGTTTATPTFPADEPVDTWAINFARSLETTYPNWLSVLPACPCTDQAASAAPSEWTGRETACMPKYHPGAATGYRSVKGYASVEGTSHGQQCCYDAQGNLITEGQAAGTPDIVHAPAGFMEGVIGSIPFVSGPGAASAAAHAKNDVLPFEILGWEIYNRYWKPNNANNCPPNKVP